MHCMEQILLFLSKFWPDQHCKVGQPGEVRCIVKLPVAYEYLSA